MVLSFFNALKHREENKGSIHCGPKPGTSPAKSKDAMFPNKLDDLVDEIRAYIEEISSNSFTKEEILRSISIIIRKYPWLKDNTLKYPISNLVAVEAEMKCNLVLHEEDLKIIWT